MTLTLPSELVVERFLPTARAMLARNLRDRGFTQKAIASHLGVTQAAVSGYLSDDATIEPRFSEHPRMQSTMARIADGFADETMDEYEALAALLALVREFEDRGPMCELHEAEMPALAGLGCDLCVRGTDAAVTTERDVLANVRKATRTLQNAPEAVEFVPNVGTNVAMALPDAVDETDVAAVPGRLHAMHGRINVPSNPEFGASRHVAGALLAVADAGSPFRGALNLTTDDALLDAARDRGFDPLEFDADYEDRGAHLRERFTERGGVPPVVFHRGAFGIEPITYVFGETAVDAVDRALDLVADAQA